MLARYIWRKLPNAYLTGGLLLFLGLSCFCGLLLGYLPLTWNEVGDILAYRLGVADSFSASVGAAEAVWDWRLPRVLLAAGTGMGLSLSGVIMQAIFRNPMADPYIMGISSGASLGVASAVFLGIGTSFGAASVGIGAFVGALALSVLLLLVTGWMKEKDISTFLIFGVALSAVAGGITGVLVFFGANSSGMDVTLYWLMGTVAFAKIHWVLALLFVVFLEFIFFFTQARMLNLMLEGEETAIALGRRLMPFIRFYLSMNALLVGMTVMNAGLLGFVGLLVPHGVRILTGADHRRLLPAAVLVGGIVSVWADILGRTLLHGVDIPLGVILALFGAPLFIFLLAGQSYRFGGGA